MRTRTAVIVSAVAAVAVAAAAAGAWWMLRPPSLRDTAEAYLHALETGDIDTIDTMMADLPLTRAERATIDQAFTGASGHLTSAHIDDIGPHGGVRATARLDGSSVTVSFVVGPSGALAGDFLGSLTVSASEGAAVRVGDATVHAGTEVHLLPAVYPVQAMPDDILRGSRSVPITNDAPVAIDLAVSIAPGAAEVAERQLAAYEDRCAASADSVPAHCGLRVPWAADLRTLDEITFHIDRRPRLTLAADGATFAATGGHITATARGEGWDGASATFSYRTDEWSLRGRVVFDGPRMQLRVD